MTGMFLLFPALIWGPLGIYLYHIVVRFFTLLRIREKQRSPEFCLWRSLCSAFPEAGCCMGWERLCFFIFWHFLQVWKSSGGLYRNEFIEKSQKSMGYNLQKQRCLFYFACSCLCLWCIQYERCEKDTL